MTQTNIEVSLKLSNLDDVGKLMRAIHDRSFDAEQLRLIVEGIVQSKLVDQ